MLVSSRFKNLILFSSVFLIESCKNPNPTDRFIDSNLAKELNGTWGSPEGHPGFRIQDDSIYHYPLKAMLPCYFKKDTFSVRFPDRDTITLWGTVNVVGDTLFITKLDPPNYIIKAYRVK
jgi:hypothetical protein